MYTHNLQRDIVGILDTNGSLIVEFNYDDCGKSIAVTGSMADNLSALDPSGIAGMPGMRRRVSVMNPAVIVLLRSTGIFPQIQQKF